MSKSIVSIIKGTNVEKMLNEALSLLGGLTSLIKPNSTVVIKPNAGHPSPPETSVNTSPGVVAGVIKMLRQAKPKEIILAEASAIGCDTLECLKVCGIRKAAEEAGIDRVIDIKREKDLIKVPIRDARSGLTKVLLPRFLIEADHIINVPIFKSHCSMVFTCALKNIKGVVQDRIHSQMHQTVLADAMMDLWSVIKADLSIADLIRPAEGFGPHNTSPTNFGCVVVGKDPVAVDATVCRMVGLDLQDVDYFGPAVERGLGNIDEDLIEIRGNSVREVYKKLWLPYLEGLDAYPEYNFYIENACSSCQGLLALTLEKLKALGQYEKNQGIDIVVGPKKELPKGVRVGNNLILAGDCLKKYRKHGHWVAGCPPLEPLPLWAITDREDQTELTVEGRRRLEKEGEVFDKYARKKYGR
jgi:uncharacterized protein (DUF362 family)